MKGWAKGFGILGLLLTGLGILPAALQLTIWPMLDPVLAALTLYSVFPLGLMCLAFAAIFFLIWLVRR
jgi:hypothetical protein